MHATGGYVTIDGDYRIHTFKKDGILSIIRGGYMEILAIGGGGGGGTQPGNAGEHTLGGLEVLAGTKLNKVGAGGIGRKAAVMVIQEFSL